MTDSNTDEVPFCVDDPFTANDYADLIVRSSDGHDFYVLRGVLAIVSTVFEDMFSLPQGHRDTESDVAHTPPIVDVSESGPVVDALLRYVYPVNALNITSLEVAFSVLLAAKKYEMDRPLYYVKDVISDLRSSDDECILRSFALAYTYRLSEEVQASAAASLRMNLMDAVLLNSLDDVSGKAVIRLFRYHIEVRQKLAKLFSAFQGFPTDIFSVVSCKGCSSGTTAVYYGPRCIFRSKWWFLMCQKIVGGVQTNGPMSKDIFSQEILKNAVLDACSTCMPSVLRFGVEKLYHSIYDAMRKVVSEVEFKIPWVEE